MTVDVEEHFQVSAFEGAVSRGEWERHPSRVVSNTSRLLDLFDEAGVQATFFVLGWIAERRPELVRRIAERGHEIASHGVSHRLVHEQAPDDFRAEAARSKSVLEDAIGAPVHGYRAASFSITRRCLWALDALVECGYRYDSSIFPVRHDRYGLPGAPRRIHRLRTAAGHTILEVPPSTVRLGGLVLPVGGGGYLRLYPLPVTRWAIRRLNRDERMPAIVYVHPWELDPEQPRIRASWPSRFRHYRGLAGTADKLRQLTRQFRFGRLRDLIDGMDGLPEWAPSA